jgi:hypothetical protein
MPGRTAYRIETARNAFRSRIVRHWRRMRAARDGTSTIEVAIVAPLVILLMLGVVDLAIGYSRKLALDQAAQRAIGMVRAVGATTADPTAVRSDAAAAAGVPVEQVSVDQWLECDAIRQDANTLMCPDGQQIARYMGVTIAGSYAPIFSALATGGQTIALQAQSSARVQ